MHNRRRSRPRTYRPHLETLEARDVPATLPWTPLRPPVAFDTVPAIRADRFDPFVVPAPQQARTPHAGSSSVLATLQRGLARFLDGLDALGQRVADAPAVSGVLACSLATTALATALEVGRRQVKSAREKENTGVWSDVESWLGDPLDFTPARAA
jgi:hypothetical protein